MYTNYHAGNGLCWILLDMLGFIQKGLKYILVIVMEYTLCAVG